MVYSLLVISTLLFDKSPYKNCLVMGHVLDEHGIKMTSIGQCSRPMEGKRTGCRCHALVLLGKSSLESQPLYQDAVSESQRRFLGTRGTYIPSSCCTNIDKADPKKDDMAYNNRSEMDRWLLSKVNSTNKKVRRDLDNLDITGAARTLESLIDDISNWYVSLTERYWKSEMDDDKIAAYLTLYEALVSFIKMAAPFGALCYRRDIPEFSRSVYPDADHSIHLCDYPEINENLLMRHWSTR